MSGCLKWVIVRSFRIACSDLRTSLTPGHYANADLLLQEVKRAKPAFSAIRVWPHHFDIVSLCAWNQEQDESKTIGIGLSPGTASYNEPYWYVTPWPYQGPLALAPVDGAGSWHTDGWIGAVLPTSRLVRDGEAGRAGAEIPALRDSDLRGRPAEECRPIEGGVLVSEPAYNCPLAFPSPLCGW